MAAKLSSGGAYDFGIFENFYQNNDKQYFSIPLL